MNFGKIKEANALATRVSSMITHNNAKWLMDCDPRAQGGAKTMWAKVNGITG